MTTTASAGAPSRGSLAERLSSIVGEGHVLRDPDVIRSYTTDWTGRFAGPALLVVRPGATGQVAEVLRSCAEARTPVVVQGGNTGLVGGAVPPPADFPTGCAPVVLTTTRLAEIGPVDEVASQVTAGAGATLAGVQAAARGAGLLFPVDLAARESATVGGMVATNAGGLHVMRYGSMRRQVLGAEVALADGSVLVRLSGLVKDNTGYDLSQLMVGSEGTLGVVTAVRLRLVTRQPQRAVALLGVGSTSAAVALAAELRRRADGLTAAEIFYQQGLDLVCHHGGIEPPFPARRPVYLLVESTGRHDVVDQLASVLVEAGVDDEAAAVCEDESGATRLWAYRERHTEAVSSLGVPHKLDVTLPLRELATFEQSVRTVVADTAPRATLVLFGHVGDGNLHVNVVGPPPDDEAVDDAVLELVARLGGSISAEHGIGRAKVRWLRMTRSPAELAAMQAVKDAFDPDGMLNPGVLFEHR
ncbi:MAG: FAD-binding oxidoreductase [Acidimicrobiales bacterium]